MADEYESVVEFVDSEEPSTQRIAICGQFRGRGGDARVVEQQAIDLTEAGYEVTIFALEADMDVPEGVKLKQVNPVQDRVLLSKVYWLLFPILPWVVYSILRLREHEMAISHRYPFNIVGYVSSKIDDTTHVYWSHPSADTAEGFTGLAGVWSRIIHRFETRGRAIERADYICAVSTDSKQYLQSFIDRKIVVVPNKINERRFTEIEDLDILSDKYGIKQDNQIILFVGRITERKNLHSLIEIFECLSQNISDVSLVIAGSASQKEYADKIKQQAGSNVIFTGYVTDPELAGLYTISDVFTTCSLEEGWGLPITEAQYFDTPVVAFESHPAAKEVTDKKLVEFKDYPAFERALFEYLS